MLLSWNKLPLFEEWDYEYSVDLEGSTYSFRIHYSDRTEKWSIDVSLEDGEVMIQGEALLPYTNVIFNKVSGLSGFIWLEAVSLDDNETMINPERIDKYFNLYYIYPLEG